MAAREFDDVSRLVSTWRAEMDALTTRVATASLPVDVWAENYAHVSLSAQEAAMGREFRAWLDTLPEVPES